MYTDIYIYARKHNCKLRYVLVGWSSCLPAVGCNMMVESSSLQLPPPAVGHKLIYIPYILYVHAERLILYNIYRKLRCAIFLSDTFLRPPEGENSDDRRGGERRARVRCLTVRDRKSWQNRPTSYRRVAKRNIVHFVLAACSRDAM